MVVANSPKRIFARRAALRVRPLLPLRVELLEQRRLLAIVTWTGAGDGTNWSDPLNWSAKSLPGAADDVTIGNAVNTVIHAVGNDSIKSLHSSDPFTLSGGILTVSGTVQIDNTFQLSGGTLAGGDVLRGSGGQGITATPAGGTLDGVTLDSDLDMSQGGNASMRILDGLMLNGTALLGNAGGTTFGRLTFGDGKSTASQTFSGAATVLFGGNANNALLATIQPPGTMIIASTVSIHGQNGGLFGSAIINQGTISSDTAGSIISVDSITNQGTMTATGGGELRFGGTWTNASIISATGGTLDLGQGTASWTNTGTISANDSTVNLGGVFTLPALGQFTRSDGIVNLVGTLDNTGTTLALNATTGSWNLSGGTIKNGTLNASGGQDLIATVLGGTLDGLTIDGDLDLSQSIFATITVEHSLVLNGTAFLGKADKTTFAHLIFGDGKNADSQTLSGAVVLFGGSSNNSLVNRILSPGTLTIASNVLIHGQVGSVSGGAIINQGTITSDTAGGTLKVSNLTNQGTLQATAGSLAFNGPTRFDGLIKLSELPSATISWSGDLLGNTHSADSFNPQGTLLLNGAGTAISPQLLEAMSADLGYVPAGFTNNFDYGTLALGNKNYVKLVDQDHNSNVPGPEALYVDSLVVPAGSTLDVNGLHVYARKIQIDGSVINGTVLATAPIPAISISDAQGLEPKSGTTPLVFTVNLSQPGFQPVTVGFATADGTATVKNNDYVATRGTLTFDPGVSSQTITVPLAGGRFSEPSESFQVDLSSPTNAILSKADGEGTIFPAQTTRVVNFDSLDASSGPVSAATLASYLAGFGISISHAAPSGAVSVINDTTRLPFITASSPHNYLIDANAPNSPISYELDFAAPLSSFQFTRVQESGLGQNAAGWDARALDSQGKTISTVSEPQLTTSPSGITPATPFTLAGPGIVAVVFERTSSTDSVAINAVPIDDLVLSSNLLPQASSLSGFVYLDANDDGVKQPSEAPIPNVAITLSGTSVAGDPVNLTTATDANGAYSFAHLQAGNYRITETQPSGFSPGRDTIGTQGGAVGNDSFSVSLPATVDEVQGINNNFGELGPTIPSETNPIASVSSVSVSLSSGGITPFVFTFTVSNPNKAPLTLHYATEDGTAHAADGVYQPASGTLTFGPGTTSQSITVVVNGALAVEPSETFKVNLSNSANTTLAQGTGTILTSFQSLYSAIASSGQSVATGTSTQAAASGLGNAITAGGLQPSASASSLMVLAASGGAGGGGKGAKGEAEDDFAKDARPGAVDAVMATFLESNRRGIGAELVDKLLNSLSDADEPHLLGTDLGDEVVKKQVNAAKPISAAPQELPLATAPTRTEEPQAAQSDRYPWWLPVALFPMLLGPWIWTYRRRVFNSLSGLRHRVGL
jgi:hypothetical protein